MIKYNKALVIGKFQPLHKGHLSLIDFATTKANKVLVCVTAHKKEIIPLNQRLFWVKESYTQNENVSVCGLSYDPTLLNESSVSNLKSSEEWAEYLKEQLDDFSEIDVIVGSELYVKYMADYLGIDHIIYDESRENIHISATDIKQDVVSCWDYLAPAVKRSLVKHICVCGSESTGKTTVCKKLEEEYSFVTMIPEIGRCLVGKSELCTIDTLKKIFAIHNDLLTAIKYDPPTPIILWDTDNITTLSYFTYLYPGRYGSEIMEGREVCLADYYFFFESNISFCDDGTRFSEGQALSLSLWHKKQYENHKVSIELVNDYNRYDVVKEYVLNTIERIKRQLFNF